MNTSAVRHLSFYPFVQALARLKTRFSLEAAADDLTSCELVWWKRSTPAETHTVPMSVSICTQRTDKWTASVDFDEEAHYIKYGFILTDRLGMRTWYNAYGFHEEQTPEGSFEILQINETDVLRLPAWSQGCIYYQIFPERFAKSGKVQGPFDAWDAAPTRENFLGGNLRGIIERLPYMNILYNDLVDVKTVWNSIFEYGINILCSLFLLMLQAGMMRESRMEKRLQMVSMLWEQAREQYRVSRENIEAINIKCHDLKHQLLAFKDKTDESEYAHLMELVDSYGAEIETNNEVLDVVFQEKNFQCRKLGIQFTCIIDGAALNFMDTTDLYVLFGNLIDNCIEAVSHLPETEVKNVQVSVRKEKGFVIISTENGYTGELQWMNGRLRTSKADTENHGFGILSIERIIKKYGGRYSINTEDQIFSMNIVFPICIES